MKTYEIINPSDKYSLKSGSFLIACLATCFLGGGAYGLQEVDGDESMPVFILGGHDDWFTEKFGKPFGLALEDVALEELATCLESVVIGDRDIYEQTIARIAEPDRADWIEMWNDKNRSSMNDIDKRAKALAESMRAK